MQKSYLKGRTGLWPGVDDVVPPGLKAWPRGYTTFDFHRPRLKTTAPARPGVEKAIVIAQYTPAGPQPSPIAKP
jgi:hypothetical protein